MIPWLNTISDLPAIETALDEPNGLLAAGGELSPQWLLTAYKQGVFPWFSDEDPILWWSPAPRCIAFPDKIHCSKSLKKQIRQNNYTVTWDKAFERVIQHCSERENTGTWITDDMLEAYTTLHGLGSAHSVEVWNQDELIGGLYGIAIGKIFFGESMFSLEANASKIAFNFLGHSLCQAGFKLIDCQVSSPHLSSLGCIEIDRAEFQSQLVHCETKPDTAPWHQNQTYDAKLLV